MWGNSTLFHRAKCNEKILTEDIYRQKLLVEKSKY